MDTITIIATSIGAVIMSCCSYILGYINGFSDGMRHMDEIMKKQIEDAFDEMNRELLSKIK